MSSLSHTTSSRRRIIFGAIGLAGFSACKLRSADFGDHSTDDTASLNAEIGNFRGKRLIITRTYRVEGGTHYFSDKTPDLHSAALTIRSSMIIDGVGSGLISCSTPDKSVIQVYDGMMPVTNVVIRNLRLSQPNSLILGDGRNHGLTDDYFALRFNGTSYCQAENVIIESCSLGVTFQYNQYAKPKNDSFLRASHNNKSEKITIKQCTYMGLQLGGESDGTHTNYVIEGKSRSGKGRAAAHGIRLVGYDNASSSNSVRSPCQNNNVTGHLVRGFSNAISIQQWVRSNVISLISRDCGFGVNITRQPDESSYGNSAAATAQQNSISIDHDGGNYGIYNAGGARNQFEVKIANTSHRAIYEPPARGTRGLATGNSYRGTIIRPGQRGADLGGDDTIIDLEVTGNDTNTTDFGCVVSGSGSRGSVTVRRCRTGVQLTGTRAVLSIKASECTNALVITGNDNTINCNIDGNVIITGSNNKLSGRVRGRVSVARNKDNNDLRALDVSA